MAKVIIIDDEQIIHGILTRLMQKRGHKVVNSLNMFEGLDLAHQHEVDLVILDLNFPEGNGLQILPQLLDCPSLPEVIILTGIGDHDGAQLAYEHGAWDFLQKPFSTNEVALSVTRALQYREEKRATQVPSLLNREGIIGSSQKIQNCLAQVAQAAASNVNTLITGETGTGKELFAQAIHQNSNRKDKNFVVVDCTVLPDALVESTLFGHEKGAFTSADHSRTGLISQADQGTLFLDEVGELPLSAQKSFLRVLQERAYRPVGGKKVLNSDFRLIAATNQDLDQMVADGAFRSDLLYRLKSTSIQLPPLRERKKDISDLVQFYLARLGAQSGIGSKGFSPEFLQALKEYAWPGNVRELINTLERALAAAGSYPTLYPKHLPAGIRIGSLKEPEVIPVVPGPNGLSSLDELPSFKEYRSTVAEMAEFDYLREVVSRAKSDRDRACEISSLSPARLYALLKKHDLPRFGRA
jgi:two-component system NtrC family response regulator